MLKEYSVVFLPNYCSLRLCAVILGHYITFPVEKICLPTYNGSLEAVVGDINEFVVEL